MRRQVAVGLVALLMVLLTATALVEGSVAASGAARAVRQATPHALPASCASANTGRNQAQDACSAAKRPFQVSTTTLEVPVPATGRVLSTEVWYPATKRNGGLVPDRSSGPYPLVVFSQGYDEAASAYSALIRQWAAAGFVVAAPTYPYTAPPGPLDEADIINHPVELRSVLGALTSVPRRSASVLAGLVDPGEVGLAGQSDGGDVSLAVADNTCCHDPAVKAVAVLSGAELSSFGGTYFTGPQVPLLVVQGSADTINVPACSSQIYNEAKGTKYYLDLLGASHLEPYVPPVGQSATASIASAYRRVAAQVTTDFFEVELARRRGALASMEQAGEVPRLAQFSVGGEAPPTGDWCNGSPAIRVAGAESAAPTSS